MTNLGFDCVLLLCQLVLCSCSLQVKAQRCDFYLCMQEHRHNHSTRQPKWWSKYEQHNDKKNTSIVGNNNLISDKMINLTPSRQSDDKCFNLEMHFHLKSRTNSFNARSSFSWGKIGMCAWSAESAKRVLFETKPAREKTRSGDKQVSSGHPVGKFSKANGVCTSFCHFT